MALDVLKGGAATVTFLPAVRWSSASAEVIDPGGTVLATPTATLDSVSTTITGATDAFTLTLTSAAGVSVGSSYEVISNGHASISRVATVSGSVVTLDEPLPATPSASDTFKGVEFSVPVTASETGTIGVNYSVRVFTTASNDELRAVFHVVYHKFSPPMTAQRLRQLMAYKWKTAASRMTGTLVANVVERTNDKVRRKVLAKGQYAFLYGDSNAFSEAGVIAAKRVLIDHGFVEAGADVDEYARRLDEDFRNEMGDVMTSLQSYDASNDGAVNDELPLSRTSVRLRR